MPKSHCRPGFDERYPSGAVYLMSTETPTMPPEAAAALLLNQIATGYMASAALQVALKLEIADRLARGRENARRTTLQKSQNS